MTSPKLYSYNPDDLILLIGGVEVRPADSVVISRSNDVALPQPGILGDHCIATNLDKQGTLTIPLMAQSDEDLAFDQWAGDNVFLPISMLEKSTRKVLQTNCCYLTQPDLSYGQQTELRAHTIWLQNSALSYKDGATNLYDTFDTVFNFGESDNT
jgi:hypothetical protein